MKLLIHQIDGTVKEVKYSRGPIYIGRRKGCQVFLPDRTVSRQHAVIYDEGSKWILEDIESASKTYLNDNPIHKAQLHDGDTIRISIFTMDVVLGKNHEHEKEHTRLYMEETMVPAKGDLHVEIRQPASSSAAPVKIPTKRIKEFSKAVVKINDCDSLKDLHKTLIELVLSQFKAVDAWVGLRESSEGSMERTGGKRRNTVRIDRDHLAAGKCIEDVMKKCHYALVPEFPREVMAEGVRSAIIAPIVRDKKCYGVVYAENSSDHGHYVVADLDYLMLITIVAGAAIEKL